MINKFLPSIDELKPITNEWNTFYKCGFNKEFNSLTFIQKLQIVNDLVRQTIKPASYPNPSTELLDLVGDCHTAANAVIEYLKYLNIGKNIRYVMCRQKPYEIEDVVTRHAAVLVDDDFGNTYFVDATPFVGYMFGKVVKLGKETPYKDIQEISGIKMKYLRYFRQFLYEYKNPNIFNKGTSIFECKKIIYEAIKFPIFYGMICKCLSIISKESTDEKEKNYIRHLIKKLNPNKQTQTPERTLIKKNLLMTQIVNWKKELLELQKNNSNERRQLELAQWIFQETKLLDDSYEVYVNIGQPNNRISNLTPRVFLEEGLNVFFIKPSAYFINKQYEIMEMIKKNFEIVYIHKGNLTTPMPLTNLVPINYIHTHGDMFNTPMNGTTDIITVKGAAKTLRKFKKVIREQFSPINENKKVIWANKEIVWDSNVFNCIHSTDNPMEACLHFQAFCPEQQLLTKFMYPNPVLEFVEQKLYRHNPEHILYGKERLIEINKILEERLIKVEENEL